MEIILGDMKQLPLRPSSIDLVICNPPFREKNSGRLNPDSQRAIARHEILASLNDVLNVARTLLKARGRLALIFPVARLADLNAMYGEMGSRFLETNIRSVLSNDTYTNRSLMRAFEKMLHSF